MRLEAEERVRGVLEECTTPEKGGRVRWPRMCAEKSKRRNQDVDQTKSKSLEFEHFQEEVLVRLRRSKLENFQEMTPPEELEQEHSPKSSCFKQDPMHDLLEGSQAKVHTRKLAQWSVEPPRPAKTMLEQTQESSMDHPQTLRRQNQAPADTVTSNQPWLPQSMRIRTDGQGLDLTAHNMEKTLEQSEDPEVSPLLVCI